MAKPKSRWCAHGHDTELTGPCQGRNKKGACRACSQEAVLRWRRNNPEQNSRIIRKGVRKFKGVIGADGELRSGICGICGGTHDKLNLDHDHSTGAIRGNLCSICNLKLGLIESEKWQIWLNQAMLYLELHKTKVITQHYG